MRFMTVLGAMMVAAQVGCTVGAPAMNDISSDSSMTAPMISIERREKLPTCTPERNELEAYIREEKVFTTCNGKQWVDAAEPN